MLQRLLFASLFPLLTGPALADHFEFETDGPFATGIPFTVNLFAADVDGDTHQDILVTGGTELSVLLGDGAGGFAPFALSDLGVGVNVLEVADFDENGIPDLLAAIWGTSVELFLGDGMGGFVNTLGIDVGTDFPFITVADFDDDGHQDFAVNINVGPALPAVAIYAGDGTGDFEPPLLLATALAPGRLRSADFDGDGLIDLGVCHGDFVTQIGGLGIYHGDGGGGFAPEVLVTDAVSQDFVTGDFDGNGSLDFIELAWNPSSPCGGRLARVFVADGAGGYELNQVITGVCGPHAALVEDFDADGTLDLVLTDGGDIIAAANEATVYHGVGNGTFDTPQVIALGLFLLSSPALADFDEDGRSDIGLGALDGDALVLRNLTPPASLPFRRGDADASGAFNGLIDGLFLLNFQFAGGSAPPCDDAADVDDDGSINGLVDGLAALNFQFVGGPPPPPPGPDACGLDPTVDVLGCLVYDFCP